MPKYPGRIVSATPPSVSLSGASGVWTLEEVAQYEQAGTWPVGVAGGDPYFNQTVLLLHGDGTNGAQNNTFLDSSSNNFTITRNPANGPNAPTQGTFSPFSVGAGEWSNYFDGSGDWLALADNAAWDLVVSGDFTIQFFVYFKNTLNVGIIGQSNGAGNVPKWAIYLNDSTTVGTGNIGFYLGSSVGDVKVAWTPSIGVWYHFEATRNGNDWYFFVDGTQIGATQNSALRPGASSGQLRVGADGENYRLFNGYLSNVYINKGTALHTANFTAPTAPLTTASGVELLTCQSNRFVDNSTNAFAITRNGDVRVTPFSPFAPTAAYSAGTNGGSGYFDGTGDGLSIANNAAFDLGTGDFTIEAWIYTNTVAAGEAMIAHRQESAAGGAVFQFRRNAAQIQLLLRATGGSIQTVSTSSFLTVGAWYHVAAVRASGVVTIYVNGATDGTGSANANPNCSQPFSVGFYNDGVFQDLYWNGYLSNVRLVKGTAVTPPSGGPTSPVTAVSGTSLLCNFTNAGIFDNTGKNVLETVGNAQIDTTTKKFGTGSMEFDGTGDWLDIPPTPDLYLSTGDFTIEGWVYTNNSSVNQQIMIRRASAAARGIAGNINASSANKLTFVFGDTNTVAFEVTLTSTTSLSNNVWYHFAVVRSGNNFALYINGVSEATATSSVVIADDTSKLRIGADDSGTSSLNGYIDDLRITKGVARYPTEPFPTAPFPDL